MGNRATVIFADPNFKKFSAAVYLHWNGGPESVYQFLDELDRRNVRADQDYECARFIQIVGEFMDQDERSGLSLGVVNGPKSIKPSDLSKVYTDHGDNGFYIVSRRHGHPPVVRRFIEHVEERPLNEVKAGESNYRFYMAEMGEDEVAQERKDAYAHAYMTKDGGFRPVWGDKPVGKYN